MKSPSIISIKSSTKNNHGTDYYQRYKQKLENPFRRLNINKFQNSDLDNQSAS